jgi:hypothetical protein
MSTAKAITKDCFLITGRGLIIELSHSEDGLVKGTQLKSEISGLTWIVESRVLFDHAIEQQKKLKNESIEYLLVRFTSDIEKEKSIETIKEKEANNIYQYFLKFNEQKQKPLSGEELQIKYP